MSITEQQTITISKQEYDILVKEKRLKEQRQKNAEKQRIKGEQRRLKRLAKEKEELDNKSGKKKFREQQKQALANERAFELRQNATQAEKKFKMYLKLLGYKYSFQEPIHTKMTFFIADFYLPRNKVIIEIDGEYHNDRKQKAKDKARDKVMFQECGLRTLRITNNDVDCKGELYFKSLLESFIKEK